MATLAQLSVGIGGGTVIVPRKEKLEAAFGEPINRALGRIDSGLSAFRLQSTQGRSRRQPWLDRIRMRP
jgi:hypothetical protein